jgi:hypothetical protein
MIEASLFLILKFNEILLEGANKKVALRNYRITKLKAKPKGHAVCADLALPVHLLYSSFSY